VARVLAVWIEGKNNSFKKRPPDALQDIKPLTGFVQLAFSSPCKNRETRRSAPREWGWRAGFCPADSAGMPGRESINWFWCTSLEDRCAKTSRGNCIYRPVSHWLFI